MTIALTGGDFLMEHDQRALTITQILHWTDEWYAERGLWPGYDSGVIPGTDELWKNINDSLIWGLRGLPGGTNLRGLITERRGIRKGFLPFLSETIIMYWADKFHQSQGRWPHANRGRVGPNHTDTWKNVNDALRVGKRGLPGGSSLSQFLCIHRGITTVHGHSNLTEEQILAWAKAHFARTGKKPAITSGLIPNSEGTTWSAVHLALRVGKRNLPGGSSLAKLLKNADLGPHAVLVQRPEHDETIEETIHEQKGAILEAKS